MSPKSLVKLSNTVGTIAIILLLYWVFIFITIEVFGLKVFQATITQTFYMSIIGILVLLVGALITNIMFNLTRIAQKHNADEGEKEAQNTKKYTWALLISFPLIVLLLLGGDYMTAQQKKQRLIHTAKSIIKDNTLKTSQLLNYSFDRKWINKATTNLTIISKTDQFFPHISVIKKDSIADAPAILHFEPYYATRDTSLPMKKDFILKTTQEERDYLSQVFDKGKEELRYSAHNGRYELFYPYKKNNKIIVLHFSDYQRYGKIGS